MSSRGSAKATNLADIHACDLATSSKLATYLRSTAVPAFANELQAGRVRASSATVLTREHVGQLLSIFANLGGITSMHETGRATYLVGEVRAVLARPDCTDVESRTALAGLIEAVRSGELIDRTLTAALTDGGAVLVDGNKRAAAMYEAAGTMPIRIPMRLPIYLLEATAGVLALEGLLAGSINYV